MKIGRLLHCSWTTVRVFILGGLVVDQLLTSLPVCSPWPYDVEADTEQCILRLLAGSQSDCQPSKYA